MKLAAALLTGPRKVELFESEIPELENDTVLVQVVACGICSSEIPVYCGEVEGTPGASFRYSRYPCCLGHEVVGIVTDVGPKVTILRPGDRVTGIAYAGSGFASHVVDSEKVFVKVPDGVPLEHALGEPLTAVINTLRMANPDFGDFVFIAGDGFMSLLTVAVLSRYPTSALIVMGHHDNRLLLATEFGATHTINSLQRDAYWEVRRLVDGDSHEPQNRRWENGVDLAFEFTGTMPALQLCASLCKPKQQAKLMMASYYGRETFTLGHYLINRAPSLIATFPAHSRNLTEDLRRAVWALEQGHFPMDRVITHAFTLEQVGLAFESAMSRSEGYIKGIIVPDFSKLEAEASYKRIR